MVQPETVVRRHRAGFRRYWRRKSIRRSGRPRLDPALRQLIRDMWSANPTWGKRRIQAELAKLGIEVRDSTVARYWPARRSPQSQTWKTFLDNHVRDIVAMDFLTVPTATFRVLYVLVVMSHDRRRIVRECLDHAVILGEEHLRRVLGRYVAYYNGSRTHRSLDGDCPKHRTVEPPVMGTVVALPQVGGLHHRHTRRLAE